MNFDIQHVHNNEENINFQPLKDLIGDEYTSEYMWMGCAELYHGPVVQFYKHCATRKYVYIDRYGSPWELTKSNHNKDEDAFRRITRNEGMKLILDNSVAQAKQDVYLDLYKKNKGIA